MKIYAISGLGANERVFDKLTLPANYNLIFIPWLLPHENESMENYAERMAQGISHSEDFVLLGLSFGGIVAQEVARIKKPKILLLFNTVKSDAEKPLWIRVNKYLKLYRNFPYSLLNRGPLISWFSGFMQLLNSHRPNLDELYSMRDELYTRWAFEQMAWWDRQEELTCEVYHFHGNLDIVFPYWNIKNAIKINGGGHLSIYVKANDVSAKLRNILK
jgi:pimeloyl-ACP methyl ester carboxylesterase